MICNDCKKDVPIEGFFKNKSRKLGVETTCKICRKIKMKSDPSRSKEYNTPRMRKYRANINVKLAHNLRNRLYFALTGLTKKGSTLSLLGCTIEEFKVYLHSKFSKGMTLDNYGEWHVDHIIPCSSFDLTNEQEQTKCFHYSNLQPLWALDNLVKGKNFLRALP